MVNKIPTVDSTTNLFPTAVMGALDTRYTQKGSSLAAEQLGVVGAHDQMKSLASSTADYQDAGSLDEQWVDTSGWNTSGTFPTGSQRLYGTGTAALSRVVPVGANGRARYRMSMTNVNGGSERFLFVGWSTATPGTVAAAGNMLGVGMYASQTGDPTKNWLITWNNGANNPVQPMSLGGTYYVTVGQDETRSWAEIQDSSGITVAAISAPKSSFIPTQLAIFHSDARGATGDYLSEITGRAANVTHSNRVNEIVAPSGFSGYDSTPTNIHIETPVGYDSRKPSPLVIYCHGYGGNEMFMNTNAASVMTALAANGYIVASSLMVSGAECGSAYATIATLYKYVRRHYAIGPVIIMSESFGGVGGLLSVANRVIPNIVGWLGWYPVTNLADVYAKNSGLKTAIDAAYGSPYATKTAGFDPNLYDPTAFRGVRMRTYGSTGDATVDVTTNAQQFIAQVAPYALEATHVPTSGAHGDPSNFQPTDVLAFLSRCLGS